MDENYFLAKWLNQEITDEELKKYISEKEILSYKRIIEASKNLQTPAFSEKEMLAKILLTKKSKSKLIYLRSTFIKVAAVIALIFGVYSILETKNTIYTTNLAEKTSFELPDFSTVNLNSGSTVSYHKSRWKKNRELSLKGEAYFSVKKGSKFTVHTPDGNVTVLGTKFNVFARDNYFEVTCYEGLVSVNFKNQLYKVPAGTSLAALNSKIKSINTSNETKPMWLQDNSSFKSMPYRFVINELERQYNLKIEYEPIYANYLFTGNFTHLNLDLALQAISIPLNLKYTILNEHKVSLHK